jgi:flagellar basal-body rod protein FlgC
MGLMNAFNIGREGLSVHGKRVEIAAKNIANIDTPNYTRKIPLISSNQDQSFATVLSSMGIGALSGSNMGGVNFDGIVEDPTPGAKIYKPGHPDADENGYIRTSNTNVMIDYADATIAQRAFEASLGVMTISKAMASASLEIGR